VNLPTGQIPPELSGLESLMSHRRAHRRNTLENRLSEFVGELPNLEAIQVWDSDFTFYLRVWVILALG
ncbi:hypothetical protein PanWU01x14_059030, partial [Parasponia andersonii]